jgi:hypothetical protein
MSLRTGDTRHTKMPSETKSNTTKISTKIINLSVQGVVVGAQQRERDSTGQLGSYRWGNKTVRERFLYMYIQAYQHRTKSHAAGTSCSLDVRFSTFHTTKREREIRSKCNFFWISIRDGRQPVAFGYSHGQLIAAYDRKWIRAKPYAELRLPIRPPFRHTSRKSTETEKRERGVCY